MRLRKRVAPRLTEGRVSILKGLTRNSNFPLLFTRKPLTLTLTHHLLLPLHRKNLQRKKMGRLPKIRTMQWNLSKMRVTATVSWNWSRIRALRMETCPSLTGRVPTLSEIAWDPFVSLLLVNASLEMKFGEKRALYLFDTNNQFRVYCGFIVTSKYALSLFKSLIDTTNTFCLLACLPTALHWHSTTLTSLLSWIQMMHRSSKGYAKRRETSTYWTLYSRAPSFLKGPSSQSTEASSCTRSPTSGEEAAGLSLTWLL